jgi:predicted XRE-type DNA-binding protein
MVSPTPQKISLRFFRSASGNEPVRDWLKDLDEADRRTVGQDLMRAQWRWPVGMPLCRAMGQGLWEIRTNLDCARVVVSARGQPGGAARLHQEDAEDPGRRTGAGAQAVQGAAIMSKKHIGSSLDDFLKEEGTYEEAQALAIKEVVVWQLTEAMQQQSLSKARLATLLKTSRSQVDRLLDPTRDVTLSTLQRAAALVGRKPQINLV